MIDRYWAWCPECQMRTRHEIGDESAYPFEAHNYVSRCTECDAESPEEAVEAYHEMCVEHLEQQWAMRHEVS